MLCGLEILKNVYPHDGEQLQWAINLHLQRYIDWPLLRKCFWFLAIIIISV